MSFLRRGLPFALLFALGFGGMEAAWLARLRSLLLSELRNKSQATAAGIGHPLNEAFAMGEYDRIQRALDGLKAADPDIDYAIGIEIGSQVIASTDALLRNRVLTRNEFEASAWQISEISIRENPNKPKVFEVVVPVKFRAAQMGVLRIGVSWSRLDQIVRRTAFSMAWLAVLLAAAFGWLGGWICSRDGGRPKE